jgi:hypothetical protein
VVARLGEEELFGQVRLWQRKRCFEQRVSIHGEGGGGRGGGAKRLVNTVIDGTTAIDLLPLQRTFGSRYLLLLLHRNALVRMQCYRLVIS